MLEDRVPEELFEDSGHYLGRPADMDDRIIHRRLRLVEQVENFVSSEKSLLEIGCGNGASILRLAPKMKMALGIDINDLHFKNIDFYKQKWYVTNCDFKVVDIENNNPSDEFDRIISFEVIEHLNNEELGLKYFHKALKSNGLLAVSVPNKWWIFETHGAKLPLLPWNRVPFFSWLPTFIHEKFANARIYSKKRIVNLLENNGFEVLKSEYIMAPMDVLPKGKFKDFMINTFFNSDTTKIPFKSTSIFVLAKKK